MPFTALEGITIFDHQELYHSGLLLMQADLSVYLSRFAQLIFLFPGSKFLFHTMLAKCTLTLELDAI